MNFLLPVIRYSNAYFNNFVFEYLGTFSIKTNTVVLKTHFDITAFSIYHLGFWWFFFICVSTLFKAMKIKKNILITLQHHISNSTHPKHHHHYWKQEQVYFFVVNPIHLGDLKVSSTSFCRIMPIRWFLIFVDLFTLPQSSRSLIPSSLESNCG